MKSRDHLTDFFPSKRIIDALAVTARLDKIVRTQTGKLLRNGGLSKIQALFEFGDRLLPFRKLAEDDKPRLMR